MPSLGRLISIILLVALISEAHCKDKKLGVKRLVRQSSNIALRTLGHVNNIRGDDTTQVFDADTKPSRLTLLHASQCFDQRALSNQLAPTVYLISPKSKGCSSATKVPLDRVNGASVKSQLIDSRVYNATLKTYFIVHGFLGSWRDSWMCKLKNKIQRDEPANIFLVDWAGSKSRMMSMDYSVAVTNAKWIGQRLAKFVRLLMRQSGQPDASSVHFLGFSLGAQISGFAGNDLDGTLGRITGIDPAGPCFESDKLDLEAVRKSGFIGSSQRRLSQASAQQVVAIHTDINRFGLKEPVGHVDVYLNGGESQPGCSRSGSRAGMSCNHSFSHVALSSWSLEGADEQHQCYPIAHRCSSWAAFRAGECGLCEDDQCVHIGVPDSRSNYNELANSIETDLAAPVALEARTTSPNDKFKRQQHFLLTADGHAQSVCLFHYQLLIAVNPELADMSKFHVEIQLPQSLKRLARVSHLVGLKSPNLAGLKKAIGDQHPALGSLAGLRFYSALLTFKLDPDCSRARSTDWTLCGPLEDIRKLRIFAESGDTLDQVNWVAINYMSGIDSASRQAGSFVFAPSSDKYPAKAASDASLGIGRNLLLIKTS